MSWKANIIRTFSIIIRSLINFGMYPEIFILRCYKNLYSHGYSWLVCIRLFFYYNIHDNETKITTRSLWFLSSLYNIWNPPFKKPFYQKLNHHSKILSIRMKIPCHYNCVVQGFNPFEWHICLVEDFHDINISHLSGNHYGSFYIKIFCHMIW